MTGGQPSFAVIGEALIDLAGSGDDEPWLARPGGSPYNVAIGLARLDRPAAFVGRISRDPLGTILRNHAASSGVDLSQVIEAREPTTVALVALTDGVADYHFGIAGTADFQWTEAELTGLAAGAAAVHFGSLASWTPPGAAVIARRIAQLRNDALISYDPNVRPHLQADPIVARSQVEEAVGLADLVKTSVDDLAWLYPDDDPSGAARRWLELGAALVVVTSGAAGATAYTPHRRVSCPAHPARVVDTIGAGDAFMAGLLDALAARGRLHRETVRGASADDLAAVLADASLVASLTCARAGANPPRRAEIDAVRD